MRSAGKLTGVILLTAALVSVASFTHAGGTTVDVGLGERFEGTIGTAGADFVAARLNLAAGTDVKVTVRGSSGSDLRPTVAIKDAGGTDLGLGSTLSIEWLPVPNAIHEFRVPTTGIYMVEIGGASGSGAFTANASGRLPSGVVMTEVSGQITDGMGGGIAGAVVTVGPFSFVTDAMGNYSGVIPSGTYDVTVDAPGFDPVSDSLNVGGSPASFDLQLGDTEVTAEIAIEVTGDSAPGSELTATVVATLPEGETVSSVVWTATGAMAALGSPTAETTTVTLGDDQAYLEALIGRLETPAITEEELPENVPVPEDAFSGGIQNRFQVAGINPFALEEAGVVELHVEVTTNMGTYTEETEIHSSFLALEPTTGLRNVPIDVPVLMFGKSQAAYDWAFGSVPAGSTATLAYTDTRHPVFTPDVPGLYEIEVTEMSEGRGGDAPRTIEVWAGTWQGIIVGQDENGRPVPDGACMTCHSTFAPDLFTPWAQTGHAEILTDLLNTSTHYGDRCFSCHVVGYSPNADNGGGDEAPDYEAFLSSGLINNPGDNWTTMLEDYPEAARMSNVQCESCHGPQAAGPGEPNEAHFGAALDKPRVSLSSDVCATCHGEPLRHARFQQWQLSAHANYELAIDEAGSGSCSRCHTGNGFLAWLPDLLDDDPDNDEGNVTVTWTEDEAHPQTCATCHDPHASGTTSGNDPNATVRISGDTPNLIGGFQVNDAGKGAICMTCHNSRRGLFNDDVYDAEIAGTSNTVRAPHGSAQTDVLVGQNAFFVEVGARESHGNLENTCVDCHMRATPPPDLLAYNGGGTNHTFYAGEQICAECHDAGLEADDVQNGIQSFLDTVADLIELRLYELMEDQIAASAGNYIDLGGGNTITDMADVAELVLASSRGRQAIMVIFEDGSEVGPARLNSILVKDAGDTELAVLYEVMDPDLGKAGWNYHLFNSDGSVGVHNPSFAWTTLIATRAALNNISSPTRMFTGATQSASRRANDGDTPPWVQIRATKPLSNKKDLRSR